MFTIEILQEILKSPCANLFYADHLFTIEVKDK